MKLYFISQHNFDSQLIKPRIPATVMVGEDNTIPRICVSFSITGALSALGKDLTVGSRLIVHMCEVISLADVYQPSNKQVPDVAYTGELWILCPIVMNFYLHIEVIEIIDCITKEQLDNMLEDVVNELDLSELAINEHGQHGTSPAELVRLVLEEKDKTIRCLRAGMKEIEK